MTIKKVGKETPQETSKEQNIEQNVDDILKAFEPNGENAIQLEDDDKGPAFPDPPDVENRPRKIPRHHAREEKRPGPHQRRRREHDGP